MNGNSDLIRIEHLTKRFPIKRGVFFQRKIGEVQAVEDVSFSIRRGETLGLVGESGSGKTTLGRTLLQLYTPTSGKVQYKNIELTELDKTGLRKMRRQMSMIFQDPYASLNPRMSIDQIVSEPLGIHRIGTEKERLERVKELLSLVGMSPGCINRYPHEFSGGQRQRIGIARSLALQPEFIVCDEPISALDVSIQAQVINLLKDLQEKFELTYLIIAHDLSMIRHVSDRVAVMYLGKIVEWSTRELIFAQPEHPYTKSLISAIPIPNPTRERKRHRIILEGDIPNPANPPSGCRFHTRCPLVVDQCTVEEPEWREAGPGHWVACHLVEVEQRSSRQSVA
jgi:oligopeptide transport system ATP-binding protein